MIHEHTPDEVNIYLLDFSSETLRAFAKAPHVGDVVLSHEGEKVNNLFRMLYKELEKSKKLFADYGGDYLSYVRTTKESIPNIIVVINNFSAFTEIYEDYEETVSYLSREGTKYGLYFVLTATTVGSVRFRMLQNFKQLFTMQLNDESDYSTVVGKTEGLIPAKLKGRGLFRRGDLFEYQIGSITSEEMPYQFIQKDCKALENAWDGMSAAKIPILPEHVNIDFLSEYVKSNNILDLPIGVENKSLAVHYYPFGKRYINLIASNGTDYQLFVSDLVFFIGKETDYPTYVLDPGETIESNSENITVSSTSKACEKTIDELFELVLYRNNTYKDALEENRECEEFTPVLIVINSLAALMSSFDKETNDKLSLILEKGSTAYKVNVLLADQAKNILSMTYEKWYKANGSSADGIWIGSGFTEQYSIKANKTTNEMREEITSEFGYSLINGQAVKLKLLHEQTEEESYE